MTWGHDQRALTHDRVAAHRDERRIHHHAPGVGIRTQPRAKQLIEKAHQRHGQHHAEHDRVEHDQEEQ
jgi:hypothetical protein